MPPVAYKDLPLAVRRRLRDGETGAGRPAPARRAAPAPPKPRAPRREGHPWPASGPPRLILPAPMLPPSENRLQQRRLDRGGARHRKPEELEWDGHMWAALRSKYPGFPCLSCTVRVRIHLLPGPRNRPDADNTVKVVLDSLERIGLLQNDRQVWAPHPLRHIADTSGPATVVVIEPSDPTPFPPDLFPLLR